MEDFGNKYSKGNPTKDPSQEFATNKTFGIHKENNYIVLYAVDDIIIQENNKLSVKDEIHKNIDDGFDEDELHDLEK